MRISLRCTTAMLDNGLRVLVHEDHRLPLVAVNLWYHVGSRNERPGHTGLAHLFEHLMFEGSSHVPAGSFDRLLEDVGGVNNGSTSPDRTNYWETVPAHALELALHLESDRMGWLAETMTQQKLDAQRDVVKNERRQSYENQPYGMAWETILGMLYPAGHPYGWPVIGFMEDLDAATLEDVLAFLHTWYVPNNASLAVAGDVGVDRALLLADHWFGGIPRGPAVPPPLAVPCAPHAAPARAVLEDAVHLARIYLAWHSPPTFAPGDAELDVAGHVLAHGRASRLHRALVHDRRIAQDVDAFQRSGQWGSVFYVIATARPDGSLAQLEAALRDEIRRLIRDGMSESELGRARNVILTGFLDGLQTVGGFGGKADRLNLYAFHTGDPNAAERDVARYATLDTGAVRTAAAAVLGGPPHAVLGIVPRGRTDLAPAIVEPWT